MTKLRQWSRGVSRIIHHASRARPSDLPECWHRVSLPLAQNHNVRAGAPFHQAALLPQNRGRFRADRFYGTYVTHILIFCRPSISDRLPKTGHRVALSRARQHDAGPRDPLFPPAFHFADQRRRFAANRFWPACGKRALFQTRPRVTRSRGV